MRRALRKSRCITPFAHLVSKTVARERLSELRHQVGEVAAGGYINGALQVGYDRDLESDGLAFAAFELCEEQPAIVDVLLANVTMSLRRCAVWSCNEKASRAPLPIGCTCSKCSTSAGVQEWMPSPSTRRFRTSRAML